MKRVYPFLAALGVGLALAGAGEAKRPAVPICIKWAGQAVPTGAGYNHVVSIENRCGKAAACVVSSDAAPTIQATAPAGQSVSLVTFRGSPVAAFAPKLACSLQ